MLLQQFDQTIFEGIITLFTLNISSECVPLHFKWEFFKTLHALISFDNDPIKLLLQYVNLRVAISKHSKFKDFLFKLEEEFHEQTF
jgi:hypothetical protein